MKKFFIIFLLIFLAGCVENFNEIYIDNGKNLVKVTVEIADDNNERMRGLMFQEKLGENEGMLFVFDDEEIRTFWMKNTLIPLDMIFMNEELEIVDIRYAMPCSKDPCKTYESAKAAKYVLEVNGNFTAKNGISTGDKIICKIC